MKRYIKKSCAIFGAMLVMISGCNSKKTTVSLDATENMTEEQSEQLPGSREETNANWDSLVEKAIVSENQGKYTGDECVGEGHRILGVEIHRQETKIYVLTMYGEYQFQDGNFVKASGSGTIPAVLTFVEDKNGEYTLTSYEMPEDGDGYTKSIQRLFSENIQEICINPPEDIRADLKRQEREYAENYLKILGRKAEIGEYGDFEHPLLTDCGVSVEVANHLIGKKDLADYPFWIGNIEKLEDGIRYVYQMDLDQEKRRVILKKTEYESGNVRESYEFDAETGELCKN